MSAEASVLLIFCEGPHDSAFVRMVLKKLVGFQVEKLKFSQMPSPFHSLFANAVKMHAAEDMSLDMTHKFFLPDTVLRKNNNIVFIYNCGGKNKYKEIRDLLSDYIPLFKAKNASTFSHGANCIARSIKYLFLYDADAEGIVKIAEKLKHELSKINEEIFIDDSSEEEKSAYGRIFNDKAIFVWGGTPNKGTLEDLLMPMFDFAEENKPIVGKAKTMMKDMFTWKTEQYEVERSVAEVEKYQKAVLTTVGQRKKPGSSLTVILEQSGLITEDALKSCKTTVGFAQFVEEFFEMTHEDA